jgi:Ca2+-binding EF-hand superfamily protein
MRDGDHWAMPAPPEPASLTGPLQELDELIVRRHEELRSRLLEIAGSQDRVSPSWSPVHKTSSNWFPSPAARKDSRVVSGLEDAWDNMSPKTSLADGDSAMPHGLSGSLRVAIPYCQPERRWLNSRTSTRVNHNDITRQLASRQKDGVGVRADLLRFTRHGAYEPANACLVFVYSLIVAWETQWRAEHVLAGGEGHAFIFDFLLYVFSAVFLMDLCLRLAAQGFLAFCTLDWKWNLLDSLAIIGSVVDIFFTNQEIWYSSASLLRVLRLLRAVKVFRALRTFAHFRDLRITVSMLVDSIMPLAMFASVLVSVLLLFGIFLTNGVTSYIAIHGKEMELQRYYGSLVTTMLTLFKAISGGVDWEGVLEPLLTVGWQYTVAFYVFIVFSSLAMLNIISAMFIDYTLRRSKHDREFVVQTEMQGELEFYQMMDDLFEELDPDNSGKISLEEFHSQIMDPKVHAYFRALDLNVAKVSQMFKLMDTDRSGELNKQEFTEGCTRLRGEAKQLDLAILQGQIKQVTSQMQATRVLLITLKQHLDGKFQMLSSLDATSARTEVKSA